MNQKQLEILTRVPKIKVEDLENKSDKTLLYGTWHLFDENMTYHLYIKDEMFHLSSYVTKTNSIYEIVKCFKFRDEITTFLPNIVDLKYNPECCDYEFCGLLKSKGIIIDYKPFDKDRPNKKFYGILYEDLKKK